MNLTHLITHNIVHKRIFLRADLNVPVQNDAVVNGFRLDALRPTLDYILGREGRIVLATHRGRPHGVEPKLSTKVLIPWFKEHNYTIEWAETIETALTLSHLQKHRSIILLENLRFHQEEYEPNPLFAQKLHKLGDFYINDAFSVLHRLDTSVTSLPKLYAHEDKSVGLLIDRELNSLNRFRSSMERPFVLIIGGGKVKDKLPYCEKFIELVDTLIILPALACTFLKAQGHETGLSLVEESMLDKSLAILKKAQERGVKIVLPVDYLCALESTQGPLIVSNTIPSNGIALSVGPQSLELYEKELSNAKTIFFNGAMGLREREESREPLRSLLSLIAESHAYTGVGGGDSVTAVYDYHLEKKITFCSTGGGAALHYLAEGSLPALHYSS